MSTEAQVLGISSPPPVGGAPILSFEAIILYFTVFFIGSVTLYIIFHFTKKPLILAHKVKLAVFIAVSLKVIMVMTVVAFGLALLLPTPKVTKATPSDNSKNVAKSQRIEITFDRPVDRNSLSKRIIPEIPGVWTFEDPVYSTHLYRKVVFNPTVTYEPDTTYAITLSGISNFVKVLKPSIYSFTFSTNPSPNVLSVAPSENASGVDVSSPIIVNLSNQNDGVGQFEFQLNPPVDLSVALDQSQTKYTLIPSKPLEQGVKYTLAIKKTDVRYNIPSNAVVERSTTVNEYEGSFTTKEAPGIVRFTPSGGEIIPNEEIKISFSQPMDRRSVEENFSITPKVSGVFRWLDDSNVTFVPENIQFETKYDMKIPKATKSKSGGFMTQDIGKTFTTIGKVIAESFYPANGLGAIGINNQLKITFDQEVDKKSAEEKFSIEPSIEGVFSWARNTLIFTPAKSLAYGTKYTLSLKEGVKSIMGLDSAVAFLSQFTTQDQTIKLDVPSFLQKYSLSCEIASLRMALDYKGVKLTEDEIIKEIGFDNTPKSGNIWGNPHQFFVGNINGKQMVTGYGVYWEPIARAARAFRDAADFRNWNISNLTKALDEKNPVIIWTYSSNGSPTSWFTPSGQSIHAVRGEHAVVAVGYVGDKDNPTSIIVNDPLYGQVHWPREFFEKKWDAFGKSGVVIF